MSTLQTPMLRWSSTRDCPRKAIFEATGAPARERTPREERWLARGRSVGHDHVIAIAAESRRTVHVASGPDFMLPYPELRADDEDQADILAELQIHWQLGVGHCDAYIRDGDVVLEVLSSQHASPDMVRSKLVQAVGYAQGLDAHAVALDVVDPVTLDYKRTVVARTSDLWPELEAEVEARVAQVIEWRDTGAVPGRVCEKPSDARGHFCLHADHCFDAWQQPVLPEIQTAEVRDLARQLYEVGQIKQTVNGNGADKAAVDMALDNGVDEAIKLLRENRTANACDHLEKQIKARLTEAIGHAPDDFLADPGEYTVGPLMLKRKRVERSGYTVEPTRFETITVKRTSDAPLLTADDFGDTVPF